MLCISFEHNVCGQFLPPILGKRRETFCRKCEDPHHHPLTWLTRPIQVLCRILVVPDEGLHILVVCFIFYSGSLFFINISSAESIFVINAPRAFSFFFKKGTCITGVFELKNFVIFWCKMINLSIEKRLFKENVNPATIFKPEFCIFFFSPF